MKQSLLLLLLLGSIMVQAQTHTISGYLSDESSGEQLIGATIYESTTKSGTSTNAYGFYSITLHQDSVKLRLSYTGYQSKSIQFYLDKDTTLNISFTSANELDEVVISAKLQEKIQENSQMSEIDIPMQKVKSLPMLLGERDVLKTIQLLPGVQSGSEGGSGLYVRGGGPDQNLILLDGVPIYNASHLFGFFSVFNGDAINSVKLIKGGFPARYGGRLSSVIDLRMKEGNNKKLKGEGGIGLISSRITLDGPINDKTSFLVAARRTYIDILAQPFIRMANNNNSNDKAGGGYYFYDFNAKLNHQFSDRSRMYLSGYFGNDKFYSYYDGSSTYNGQVNSYEEKAGLKWGNAITALRWNYLITPKLFSNVTLSYSNYLFNVFNDFSNSETGPQGDFEHKESIRYFSGIQDYTAKVDFDYAPKPNHLIKVGTGVTNHTFKPGITSYKSSSLTNETDTAFGSSNIGANEGFLYVEDDFKISSRLKINYGLHASAFAVNKKIYSSIQPRISGRFLVTENTSIKASYAEMAQYLHLLTNTSIGLPTDLWLPPTERIKPQFSSQLAIGVATTLKDQYQVSLEGYYKEMKNLIEYKEGASFFNQTTDWQDKIEVGKGWSYGAEFLFEKKQGKTTGWIGYTLSWSDRQFENISFGEKFPYTYDRRHDIGIAVTHKISERTDIGMVWVYGTGNAVTLGLERYGSFSTSGQLGDDFYYQEDIEHIDQRNNYRMPAYHRLDLSINRHKTTKWGERTWSFGVYNAYSRLNPFYLYFKEEYRGEGQIEKGLYQLSIFPIIPSFSYNFKF